jgi:ATP-dependent DNA helicase RecQ
MLADLQPGIPVLATTATANARVTADVAEQLGALTGFETAAERLPQPTEEPVLVLRGSLDRESLKLGVVRLKTADQRLGWLADHLGELPGSGIVYCLTVAATQEIAGYLRARGHNVAAYSGQTETTEREALEHDLASGRVKALVATSALGMGFDATLGFVINVGAPSSPVSYYQQVGRAGRGTDEATVVLLPALEDRDIWKYFASLAFPREQLVRQTLEVLADAGKPLSTASLETYVELNRTRLETMLKVLDVDGAVRRVQGGWEGTGQDWAYDEARYARVAEARQIEQQAMLDYIATDGCRMLFLRDQLDDPGAEKCGRCDNCGGLTVTSTVSDQALSEAHDALSRPGVAISPRKMWPTALANLGIELKGKIADGAEEGRAIARLTDLGYGQQLRALFRPGAGEGAVPVGLAKAMIEVVGDWQPKADGIVFVESATRPTLTRDFADGLSRFLGIPVVGRFSIRDFDVQPGQGAANSAQRVAAVRRRFVLEADLDKLDQRTVLLLDDLVVTGWTLTLAASAIREAGATRVLPVALAVES